MPPRKHPNPRGLPPPRVYADHRWELRKSDGTMLASSKGEIVKDASYLRVYLPDPEHGDKVERWVDIVLYDSHGQEAIEIRGDRAITITPRAANVVVVKNDPR